MKKTIKFSWLLALVTFTAFISPLMAQDITKELQGFTKKFQEAYNKKDDKAIKMMFTTDAVRTDAAGVVTTGSENIRASTVDFWATNKVTVTIKQDKAEKQSDGSVITTGTYNLSGAANSGDKIDINGTYNNTVVKEKGKWVISKMVLGSM
jgi:ketosteroid isomerase-like protein